MPLNCKISADIHELNALHVEHPWLPNEFTIRPKPSLLAEKQHSINRVMFEWATVYDYIMYTVFGAQRRVNALAKWTTIPNSTLKVWAFEQSLFPYDLPAGTNHFILWHRDTDYNHSFSDDEINQLIKNRLPAASEFAWYKNPRPTVPQFWHVQVFWRVL